MNRLKEKLLLFSAVAGFILTFLNLINATTKLNEYFLKHWIAAPIILLILSSVFVYYYFLELSNKKANQVSQIKLKGDVKKRYRKYRNIILIILILLTITSITLSYIDIYCISKNGKLPEPTI